MKHPRENPDFFCAERITRRRVHKQRNVERHRPQDMIVARTVHVLVFLVLCLMVPCSLTQGEVPAEGQVAAVESLLEAVEENLNKINKNLARFEGQEMKPRELFATRTTLALFLGYVKEDMEAKRFDLALKEAREINYMADRALARLKERGLPLSRERSVSNLMIHNGALVNEAGEPVYLLGFHYSSTHPHLTYKMKKELGINLENLGVWVGGDQVRRSTKGEYTIDLEQSFGRGGRWWDDRLKERMEYNIVTDHLLCFDQGVPNWFFDLFPESRVQGNHFCPYDPDHPEVKRLNRARLEGFIKEYARKKEKVIRNSVGWCLWNEPELESVTEHTLRDFRAHLQGEYGEVAALNELWKTKFKGFDEVTSEVRQWSRVAYYDWCIFNHRRFYRHMKGMRDIIKEQSRGSPFNTHIKLMSSMWDARHSHRGIDHELLLGTQDLNGIDCWIGQVEGGRYGIHWQHQSRTYDFLGSIGPDHPILDSEWHAADSEACTETQMRAAFWLGAWHGRSGSDVWCLSRDEDSYLYWDLPGSGHTYPYRRIETMPLVFEAYAQEGIRVGSVMERIRAFSRSPRPVCIYYSLSSSIYDPEHLKSLSAIYEAFHFQDVPVGFVTERMFEEKWFRPRGVKLVIVPNARHASMEALEFFRYLDGQGMRFLFVGPGNLTRDTKDRAHGQEPALKNAIHWENADAEASRSRAKQALEWAGVEKRFSIRPVEDGAQLSVEARFAEHGGKAVGYAINLGRETVEFSVVDQNGRAVRVKELFGVKRDAPGTTMTLESLAFMNFDIELE